MIACSAAYIDSQKKKAQSAASEEPLLDAPGGPILGADIIAIILIFLGSWILLLKTMKDK